ncbi:MAG TPA: nucleotidyltransferase domain-containing protein [bacterium]|nr:nucleotidyltransferase domain-containing protein [bacterium]HOL35438.1 nucleotidyltransferase domain-containing protein [bacterium]
MFGNTTNKVLDQFVDKMKKFFEEELISVVVYGSYARGDYLKGFSDINVLVLVNEFTPGDFFNYSEMFRRYFLSTGIAPVVFTRTIFENSLDIFPLQWAEIKNHGLVIYGEDFRHKIVISRKAINTQLKGDARRFYFSLQGLFNHGDFRMVIETVFKQAKIIQRGLEFLNVGDVGFNYIKEFEYLMTKKLWFFTGRKSIREILERHMELLEKTIIILDTKDVKEY